MLFKPGNALKYTIKGSITLRYQDYSNNRVEISVSDTGLGIKKEDQKKLFKAFGKVEDKKDILLNATGVGLGLLISNVISTQLNSDYDGIKVESKYGIGSRFSFFVDDVISEELSIISDPLHHLGDIAGLEMEYKLIHYINNRKTNKIKRLTINDRNKTSSSGYITNPFSNHVPNSFTKLHSCLNNTDGFFEEVPSVMTSSKGGAINRSITEQELNIIATERQIERIRHHARSKHCNCPLFLVVDDNDFNILAFDMQFKRLEITADSALSGDEAVHKVLEFSKNKCCRFYKIIFLDIEMPVKDGFETYKEIKKTYEGFEGVKLIVIGVTGHSSDSDVVQRLRDVGVHEVIFKPFNLGVILNAVENVWPRE